MVKGKIKTTTHRMGSHRKGKEKIMLQDNIPKRRRRQHKVLPPKGNWKMKKELYRLRKENGWVFSHSDKQRVVQDHFNNIMREQPPRTIDLNWLALNLPTVDLLLLNNPFMEEEIRRVIKRMPRNKVPRPDSYTCIFFNIC